MVHSPLALSPALGSLVAQEARCIPLACYMRRNPRPEVARAAAGAVAHAAAVAELLGAASSAATATAAAKAAKEAEEAEPRLCFTGMSEVLKIREMLGPGALPLLLDIEPAFRALLVGALKVGP
jgi:hypothetical protein